MSTSNAGGCPAFAVFGHRFGDGNSLRGRSSCSAVAQLDHRCSLRVRTLRSQRSMLTEVLAQHINEAEGRLLPLALLAGLSHDLTRSLTSAKPLPHIGTITAQIESAVKLGAC